MAAPKGVTTASRSYLTVSLQDATGTMDAKKWDIGPKDEEIFAPGNIVSVEAEVLSYKNALQMKVLSGRRFRLKASIIPVSSLRAPSAKRS
jgi:23S rRNA maturation-related 3'-5' exoribonuclease YhaM